MEPSGKKGHEDARRQLLEEGARSYLEAVTALIAYRQEVQNKCREVMERNLDDYATSLDVRLTRSEIRDAAWPSFAKWKGDGWGLGVEIVKPKLTREVRWWETYCCLQYEAGEKGLYCWIGEWFPNRKLAIGLHGKFHQRDRNVLFDDKEVWVERSIKPEDVAIFDEPLEGLLQRWIGLWKKVGGIKGVFKS